MNPVFVNTIVFVKDIERSKTFYVDVIKQKIMQDFGALVLFENHFALHQVQSIYQTVFKQGADDAPLEQGKRNLLIYFESQHLEDMFACVCAAGAQLIHGIERQAWGQKVFRFFDPDGHIVEIGESLDAEE